MAYEFLKWRKAGIGSEIMGLGSGENGVAKAAGGEKAQSP
jgi:hypothetical protein